MYLDINSIEIAIIILFISVIIIFFYYYYHYIKTFYFLSFILFYLFNFPSYLFPQCLFLDLSRHSFKILLPRNTDSLLISKNQSM